jgi:hypothetical protein
MHIKILNIFQDENVGGRLYGIGELSSIWSICFKTNPLFVCVIHFKLSEIFDFHG